MNLKSLLPEYRKQQPSEYAFRFTVFTPVYNRADTISRVFESLKSQTFRDFELLIINDGSTDNSHETILALIEDANFTVQYINNPINQHKMACIIQAIDLAKGAFFLTLDSDDACTPNALEVFNKRYENIPDNTKESVGSLTCLCQDQYGNLIGEKFDTDELYSSTFGNMVANRYKSEKWGFTKTDVLKGINIDKEILKHGFIPEGLLWNILSRENFKTLYFNEILRIYYINTHNSISSGQFKNHPFGICLYSLANANWFYKQYFTKNPVLFLKQIYLLLLSSKYLKYERTDYSKALDSLLLRTIFNVCWPFRAVITDKPLR